MYVYSNINNNKHCFDIQWVVASCIGSKYFNNTYKLCFVRYLSKISSLCCINTMKNTFIVNLPKLGKNKHFLAYVSSALKTRVETNTKKAIDEIKYIPSVGAGVGSSVGAGVGSAVGAGVGSI